MTTYIIRRILQSVIFLPLAALLVYTMLVMVMPNGPMAQYRDLKSYVDESSSQPGQKPEPGIVAIVKDLEERYKLDKPWPLNFFVWLLDPSDTTVKGYSIQGNPITTTKGIDISLGSLRIQGSGILTGDFGTTTGYAPNTPISEIFAGRWLNTFMLLVTSLLLALFIGVPLGIIGATRQKSAIDNTLTVFSLGGLSIPAYVLGLLFILFLAILPKALHDQNGWSWLPWLPAGGIGDNTVVSRLYHIILPAATLAVPQIAWISRHTRFALLDVLRQDYIRTAWAKGLRSYTVIVKHALRNSLIPLITQLALLIPALVSGAVVVETVFAYEGIGKVFFRSLGGCLASYSLSTLDPPPCPRTGYFPIDYPLALVLLLIVLAIVAVCNVFADAMYAIIDPRINYESKGRK